MSNYPRGSEWRRWDLHIHSNASDGKATPKEIIDKAKEAKLSVIALTDHHTAKNIDETKTLGQENGISVISGIEFRTEYGEKSVHIIGLFPETHNGTVLNQAALHNLILSPLGLSETHIIAKGKEIDDTLSDEKAFKKGIFEVQVEFKKAADLIRSFGGIVTVHAGGKDNGLDEEMKHFGKGITNVQKLSDSLGPLKKELLEKYIDICELSHKEKSNINFYWNTFSRSSIVSSDAHVIDEIGKEFVWIKGDPNINGLRQAKYDNERIFIGTTPPALERIKNNKTKTLQKLSIKWAPTYNGGQGEWFKDINIPLNPEMTAIIGNKGSGKTAIAEIIGLLGNSKKTSDFVFLQKDKFKRKGLAKNFEATLDWNDSVYSTNMNLNDTPDVNADELVHFVPQNSFEKFCNESDEEFVGEINNVVFSRMNKENKLGFKSFDELISNKKSVIEGRKNEIYLIIEDLNQKIKVLEVKKDKDYKIMLVNSKNTIQRELDEYFKVKPIEVKPPNDLNTELYQGYIEKLRDIDKEIQIKQEELENLKTQQNNLQLTNDSLENLETNIKEKISSISKDLANYNIDIDEVFKYRLNLIPIKNALSEIEVKISNIEKMLSDDNLEDSTLIIDNKSNETDEFYLVNKKHNIENQINKFNIENEGKLTRYQQYLTESKEWNRRYQELAEKIKSLDEQISYIGDFKTSQLVEDIKALRAERIVKIKVLYKCFKDEQLIYDKFKSPIIEFLGDYQEQLKNFKTEINSGIYPLDEFSNTFVDKYIDSTVNSPFKGTEGVKKFKEYVSEIDFSSEDGIVTFVNSIENEFDNTFEDKCYHVAFKKGKYDEFVENLYKLKFLEARYSLQLFGKSLNTLSPGERGSLLLVFYLLLDARDTPLILDQPEDNLDNQSVAEILVPFIKAAKKRRQIIIITHNANLAVVSDSEQIIRVKIDKLIGNQFSFESGSLESEIINDVVDVLEGTIKSFQSRKNTYLN